MSRGGGAERGRSTGFSSPTGYQAGRFLARPRATPPDHDAAPGAHSAAPDAGWAGVLCVPSGYDGTSAAPFMLALHGATGTGERMHGRWHEVAERAGLVVLAPGSLQRTWDVLTGGYGPDVERIDRALASAFAKLSIDASRVMIEGFSDGASYALSLGLANGDLFTHVLANSPGFCWPPSITGSPRVLFTHGTEDTMLPIGHTSRQLAPQLQHAGYDVTFHEYAGGHSLTTEVMVDTLVWSGLQVAPAGGEA